MARKRKTKKKWIKGAIKRPGAFRAYCRKMGFSGVTAACIAKGKRSKSTRVKRQAILAERLKRMPRHRGPRKKSRRR